MRSTRLLSAVALLALPAGAFAQNSAAPGPMAPAGGSSMAPRPGAAAMAPGQLSGSVVSEGGQPVAGASVAVRSGRDGSLVSGAMVKPDGSFRIEGLPPGKYSVRIRALGYAPMVKENVVVSAAAPKVDLGRLALAQIAAQISGVSVTAEREVAALAPDRNTYQVKDMPAAAGGNAVDVLRNVPGVEVDGDNKVSFRGNQNVVVQINGRPTPMKGEQLGNYLAQMPSSMVAKIEVVPNPSAKDDPEGMAGIVNVVLKQATDLGRSGGINVGSGSTGLVNTNGNLGYQAGKITLFGSYGFFRDERKATGYTNRQNLYLTPSTYLDATNDGTMHPQSHNVTGTAEYRLRAKDVLSTNVTLSKRSGERTTNNYYSEFDAARALTGRYDRLTEMASRDLNYDQALTYKHTAQAQRDEISAEVRFNHSTTDFASTYLDRVLSLDGVVAPEPGRETNGLDEARDEVNAQLDVTRPLGAKGKLEVGYKGTFRTLDNTQDVSVFSYDTDVFVRDAARSNAFDYDDQVHAAYLVASRAAGKFNLQGGVRVEQATSNFALASTGEQFDNDYRSVYPSGLVSFNVNDRRQLKASYSKRVQRPDTRQLNPFEFREDALNVFHGNPHLKPEYTHAMELGYQETYAKGSLQLTPFFRRTVDAVRVVRTVREDGVTDQSFQNLATSDSYGADANGSFRFGSFNGFGGFSAFRVVSDASNLTTDVSTNSFGWSARANGSYKLTKQLDAQGNFFYRAPMNTEQGRIRAMSMVGLALRQKLYGDKASLTVRVQDPFNTMKFGFNQADTRVVQESIRRFGARGLFVNFSYNFGQQPRLRTHPQEQQQQPDAGAQPGMGPS